MGSGIAVTIFSLLAIVELVGDVLPTTPSRTAPVPLTARILMGGLSAWRRMWIARPVKY